jgi:hypothetical protein
MRRLIFLALVIIGIALFFVAGYIQAQGGDEEEPTYVGARECGSCHRDVSRLHVNSRHAQALVAVDEETVLLGDFSQGDDIRTVQFPGEDAARPFAAADVAYAIGSGRYIQRYLYAAEDGTYQVFPAEWNVVNQAWQAFDAADNWPDPAYDWVQNCAGCHVTALNVDEGSWQDDGVMCESCHGPGSAHVAANDEAGNRPSEEEIATIRSTIVLSPDAQICGQCHSQGQDTNNNLPYPNDYRPGDQLLADDVYTLVPRDDSAHWWATGHAAQPWMQYNEWYSYSAHPNALNDLKGSDYAQDECMVCHSQDYRWNQNRIESVEAGDLDGPAPESLTVETAQFGVTCTSCHTIHLAEEDIATGTDPSLLLAQDPYALCTTCHNDTDVTESMHHPTQEMYEGQEVVDQVAGVPSAHFTAEGGPRCATCHMPRVPVDQMGTRASHTFDPVMPGVSVEQFQDTCSTCHSEQVDAAGLQDLITDIQTDTQARLDASYAILTESTPEWVRTALDFVAGDSSRGVHNYVYTDALLDAVEAELSLDAVQPTQTQEAEAAPTEVSGE